MGRQKEILQGLPIVEHAPWVNDAQFAADELPGFTVLSSPAAVGGLPEGTRAVHLTGQSLVSLEVIQKILDMSPELLVIQVPRTYARRLIPRARGIRELLKQRNVELRVGRIREGRQYNKVSITEAYLAKLRAFEAMHQDEEQRARFHRMLEYKFKEAQIATLYFGQERISVREVAERLGLEQRYVEARLVVFLHWLGLPSRSPAIQRRARFLALRLDRLEKAAVSAQTKAQYRESFRAGKHLPPDSLARSQWETWQKVQKLYRRRPDLFARLMEHSPRLFDILAKYYRPGERGRTETLRQIGAGCGLGHERTRQLRNVALGRLGLLKE